MEERTGMGRRRLVDHRDRDYPILKEPIMTRARVWNARKALDQGATSQCVAYSGTQYLTAGPICNPVPMDPAALYHQCQLVDAWPGEDYDGTSVRALFKVLKKAGSVEEYRWAFNADTIVNHVLTRGPVVMGTMWFEEMFVPDRWGYIQARGPEAGGHAWLVLGAYLDRKNPDGTTGAVRMLNSWGPGWGQAGRAWITIGDLDNLVKQEGEAAVATEVKLRALAAFSGSVAGEAHNHAFA